MHISMMKRAWETPKHVCRDFLRLAQAHDLLSRAGAMLMKSSPKATVWTAGIALSGRLASVLGLPGFTRWQALAAPVVVGGGLLALGAVLRYVPRILSGRLTTVAEANDLNLMEDYRKSQVLDHLNLLWDRVFLHESALRYSPGQQQAEREQVHALRQRIDEAIGRWDAETRTQLGISTQADQDDIVSAVLSERPLSNNLEKSREGFLISALYALRHARPQSSEAYEIGFRLNLYEDFCDGAYFDTSDTKLAQQYAGNIALLRIKQEIRFRTVDSLRQLPRQISSKLWFALVTRKVALGAGRAVQTLNETYDTDAFNSQVLLWPGEEDASWLERFEGARAEVLRWRRCIIRAALGPDFERAGVVLDRAFLPNVEFATELRVRFDPEYAAGNLKQIGEDAQETVAQSLVGDLEHLGYRDSDIAKARLCAENVRAEQDRLMAYLSERHEGLLKNAAALRAVKIAFHIDKNSLKAMLQSPSPAAGVPQIDAIVEQAAKAEASYSENLISLRLHHQLTLIQLESYRSLAKALAYS